MSIDDEIIDRWQRGMLRPLLPRARGSAGERAMFVCESMWEELNRTYEDWEHERRLGALQAHLEVFSSGEPIGPKYLFLLYPAQDGVWEIRHPEDYPSLRVLGLFARKDVFIAMDLVRRDELGGWQDRRWKEVKRRAAARWRGVFFTEPPLITTQISDVVSGADDGIYYKSRA
jgi:hypothetical protein